MLVSVQAQFGDYLPSPFLLMPGGCLISVGIKFESTLLCGGHISQPVNVGTLSSMIFRVVHEASLEDVEIAEAFYQIRFGKKMHWPAGLGLICVFFYVQKSVVFRPESNKSFLSFEAHLCFSRLRPSRSFQFDLFGIQF